MYCTTKVDNSLIFGKLIFFGPFLLQSYTCWANFALGWSSASKPLTKAINMAIVSGFCASNCRPS